MSKQPLRCHNPAHPAKYSREEIIVEEARQILRRDGTKRLVAYARCAICSHYWWSQTKMALKLSQKAEAKHKPRRRAPA